MHHSTNQYRGGMERIEQRDRDWGQRVRTSVGEDSGSAP